MCHIGFYAIPHVRAHILRWCALTAQKYSLRYVLESMYRAAVELDASFNSNSCDLVLVHQLLWKYLLVSKVHTRAEVLACSPRNASIVCGVSHLTTSHCPNGMELMRVVRLCLVFILSMYLR